MIGFLLEKRQGITGLSGARHAESGVDSAVSVNGEDGEFYLSNFPVVLSDLPLYYR